MRKKVRVKPINMIKENIQKLAINLIALNVKYKQKVEIIKKYITYLLV